jgi:uncharacterized repeat protein (TIGR01451 family)
VPTVAGGFLVQPSTYMRLRAASLAANIASASSSSPDGEVEDYRLALPAFLTVTKTTLGPVGSDVGGPFTFAATNTTDSFSNVTTLTANTAVSAGTATLTTVNTATVMTETLPDASWVLTAASCIDANAANSGNPANTNLSTFDPNTLTVSIVAANIRSGAQITCSLTNTRKSASLVLTKSDAKNITISGSTNNYVVTLTNQGPYPADGVILSDVVGTGLICPAASAVVCSGVVNGAVCPAGPLTIANLTGAGITVATLPVNGALQFAYTCNVN